MKSRTLLAVALAAWTSPFASAQLSSVRPPSAPLDGAGSSSAPGITCGIHDDGVSENALGLLAGGELGWLHHDDCTYDLHAIETAYGTPLGTSPPNGAASRIALYVDPDCDGDPATGPLTLELSIATTVTNAGTDVLNRHPLSCAVDYAGVCLWVLATADHAPGEFPGPMDESNPYDGAWVVGNTAGPGTLDILDLSNNSVPPLQMSAAGFPAAWLLRLDGGGGDTFYGVACESGCDGTPCPCGNEGELDEGCVNSTGQGSKLWAQNTASISQDDFALQAVQIPDQPGIFFQGDTYLANEPVFGAGIRCCGENVVRWITVMPDGGCASTDQPAGCGTWIGGVGGSIVDLAGLSAGDTRCYQYWYRDPAGGPCPGESFNLTPGVLVTWTP